MNETINRMKFLVAASLKETERQWGNSEGLQYTNQLIKELPEFLKMVEIDREQKTVVQEMPEPKQEVEITMKPKRNKGSL